jgi:hypothetical protein
VTEAQHAEIEVLRAAQEASQEVIRRLELRLAEAERRLAMDSSNSGTPTSKEGISAAEGRKARQRSERERGKDRKRGGQPGHQGKGLKRDPDPGEREEAEPPAECRSCHASLAGAAPAEPRWAQVIDVEILRKVTEVLLPGLACGDCGTVTHATPPPGFHAGSVAYGPVLNAAAVLLSCCGNAPAERSAQLIAMLTGEGVSAGWVDKAVARMSGRLRAGGFDEAMAAALAAEDVLAADETPVNVLDKTPPPAPAADDAGEADPEENPAGNGTGNSRNGHYGKTVTTQAGPVRISVPRDRNSESGPQIVRKGQRRAGPVDEIILSLYARGLTTRDIQAHLEEVYGASVSPALISNITDVAAGEIVAWQTRPPDSFYAIIYILVFLSLDPPTKTPSLPVFK